MRQKVLLFVMPVLVVLLVGFLISSIIVCRSGRKNVPDGMRPYWDMRREVAGKQVDDVEEIKLVMSWCKPSEPIVVTPRVNLKHREAAILILRGMQEALETKKRYGNLSASVTIFWKDGSHTRTYGFCSTGDWRFCFSPWFALGVNKVVPREYRITIE